LKEKKMDGVPLKDKFIPMYMTIAETVAQQSSAKRLQVGAIVVKEDRIISIGYNGMPAGWTNDCENTVYVLDEESMGTNMEGLGYQRSESGNWYKLKTKKEVIHAEANAIAKLARCTESGDGSTMFLTHAPCIDCAKQIFTAGISSVYYRNSYRDTDGIDFLEACQVEVKQV
jgi:dCMP deaminase